MYLLLMIYLLSITWVQPTLHHDLMGYGEEDVPGMKHRQVRGRTPDMGLVGTFSTRPYHDSITLNQEFHYWSWDDPNTSSAYERSFNDPFWRSQWYQQDIRVSPGPVMDHNIVPVQRMGFNGKGISIGILGESLGRDIFDINDSINDIVYELDAWPRWEPQEDLPTTPSMASMVAGVIAMNANNSQCGAGIAYNAKITGITVMEPNKYESDNLYNGMIYNLGSLHIYVDAIKKVHDSKLMEFNEQVKNALTTIATKGRENKGGIYVVGSGNGREQCDSCGADYIVNSIHTFVIGSASISGQHATYSETCAGIIAAAYSSQDLLVSDQLTGAYGLVTSYGTSSCTKTFGGTAGSAAIASGIFALTLQANPNLSWRDLMHVIAMSSEKAPIHESDSFKLNGAGFFVSHQFGFGLLNAENMVLAAKQWKPVPKMLTCKIIFTAFAELRRGGVSTTTLEVRKCPSIEDPSVNVNYIEQVELVTTISYFRRGHISISLTSPKETESILLEKRTRDRSSERLKNWAMRTLHFWGEEPTGKWQLTVDTDITGMRSPYTSLNELIIHFNQYLIRKASFGYFGEQIRSAELLIHGTSEKPKHYGTTPSNRRRNYSFSPGPVWIV